MLRLFIPAATLTCLLALLCALVLALGVAPLSEAAPRARLWPRWQAHDASSTATIDNHLYNAFLSRYVVVNPHGPNGVRYGAVTLADIHRLGQYIDQLQAIKIDHYNRRTQRAYWMNLYNAETLYLMVVHWPVKSIRDIDSGLFDSGPWDEKRLTVEGVRLSLDDIEHRILRPIWPDGLTHYGVNCASISCPSLLPHAFTANNVDAALKDNARAYINSRQGVHFKDGRLIVSRIYKWYGQDFGGQPGVLAELRHYARPALAKKLAGRSRIDGYHYNWQVNSQANVRALSSAR